MSRPWLDNLSGVEVKSAAVIRLLLVVLAVVALGALALPRGVRRPRQISAFLRAGRRRKREEARRRAVEASEAFRYAEEIAVAARGAELTAERHRDDCHLAQERVDKAWAAYRKADAALDRARRATAYLAVAEIPTEAERERALRRAAQAAYRRGDLSDTQLLDALTHRNGWDPLLHPVEQELALARAAIRHRATAYQAALDTQNDAWRASDVATAAVHSLRRELITAATNADTTRAGLPSTAVVDENTVRMAVLV
jgi:tetratricopeptide (TPR) repeat protein